MHGKHAPSINDIKQKINEFASGDIPSEPDLFCAQIYNDTLSTILQQYKTTQDQLHAMNLFIAWLSTPIEAAYHNNSIAYPFLEADYLYPLVEWSESLASEIYAASQCAKSA